MRFPASLDTILVPGWSSPVTPRNESNHGQPQDLPKGPRIAYSVVSIFCMLLLATMLGEIYLNLCVTARLCNPDILQVHAYTLSLVARMRGLSASFGSLSSCYTLSPLHSLPLLQFYNLALT